VSDGPGFPAIPGPPPLPIHVRLETPGDEPGVRHVNLAAFSGPEEAAIVEAIRAQAPDGWHSLVAVGAPGSGCPGEVVGHLLLSPCPVEDVDGITLAIVLAIGPVAVEPAIQRQSVGTALMSAAIGLAIARAAPALVLLGYPDYYERFGFGPARALGLLPPVDAWPDAAWMARLLPAWDPAFAGRVRYPAAFEPLA
jgi:putative acetyltransferase